MPAEWFVYNCSDCDSSTTDSLQGFFGSGYYRNEVYGNFQTDLKGNIWFFNYKDLMNFDGINFKKIIIPNGLVDANQYSYSNNYDFFIDRQDNIWFPSPNCGIIKYDGNVFNHYSPTGLILTEHNNICSFFEDTKGLLWLGTVSGDILSFDGLNWNLYNTPKMVSDITNIRRILSDSKGNIYFLREYDIIKYDGNLFSQIIPSNLPNLHIMCGFNSFYIDKTDNIWAATSYYGLGKFNNSSCQWFTFPQSYDKDIDDIYQDIQGQFWLTLSDTLLSFDGSNFKGRNIPNVHGNVYSPTRVLVDKNDNKWFLLRSGTVYKYSGK